MDFAKLAPWNWFKKEEEESGKTVPVRSSMERSEFPLSFHDLHAEFNRLFDSLKHGLSTGLPSRSFFKIDLFKPLFDVSSD